MKKRFPVKKNVLLVNITRLGDMLQATPTIAGLKQENPDCKITVVVEKQFESICRIIPGIDEVLSLDLGMTVRSLAREQEGIIDAYEYLSEFVEDLRKRKFDYCLNMSSSAYTAMLLRLLDIKANGGWTADEEGYRIIESEWARLFASSVFHQNRQYNALNLVDVFRCSADVELHPNRLLLDVPEADQDFARELIGSAAFANQGPLIAIQAGASQSKRQWAPRNFIQFINILTSQHSARIVLTGTKKELPIIEEIYRGCDSNNVLIAASRTTVPQLAALLQISNVLITGDTGPMHIAAAVGTPSIAMFLASAFGFETGPYSEGNIVLQPLIGCGPCNPNKPCARPDCHDCISPQALAELTAMRLKGDIRELPVRLLDSSRVIAYRTCFDRHGFYNQEILSDPRWDHLKKFRDAYRRLWLDDLGGYPESQEAAQPGSAVQFAIEGVSEVVNLAAKGEELIARLISYIRDVNSAPRLMGEVTEELSEIDRAVEQTGFRVSCLGPVTRMFMFSKENLSGSDALGLASQMAGVYADLKRRCLKLNYYYSHS